MDTRADASGALDLASDGLWGVVGLLAERETDREESSVVSESMFASISVRRDGAESILRCEAKVLNLPRRPACELSLRLTFDCRRGVDFPGASSGKSKTSSSSLLGMLVLGVFVHAGEASSIVTSTTSSFSGLAGLSFFLAGVSRSSVSWPKRFGI